MTPARDINLARRRKSTRCFRCSSICGREGLSANGARDAIGARSAKSAIGATGVFAPIAPIAPVALLELGAEPELQHARRVGLRRAGVRLAEPRVLLVQG